MQLLQQVQQTAVERFEMNQVDQLDADSLSMLVTAVTTLCC